MSYTRWYDEDEQLKMVMHAFEQIGDQDKHAVASDILQMVFNSGALNPDDIIDDLNATYYPVRKRWYDKSETLHSAVELIKLIKNKEERDELLKEILYSIFYFTECKTSEDYE